MVSLVLGSLETCRNKVNFQRAESKPGGLGRLASEAAGVEREKRPRRGDCECKGHSPGRGWHAGVPSSSMCPLTPEEEDL